MSAVYPLHPTKARLALLRGVADGHVYWWPADWDIPRTAWSCWEPPGEGGLKVTARMDEARRAGWVELEAEPSHGYGYRWGLTDAGRAVLEEASSS